MSAHGTKRRIVGLTACLQLVEAGADKAAVKAAGHSSKKVGAYLAKTKKTKRKKAR